VAPFSKVKSSNAFIITSLAFWSPVGGTCQGWKRGVLTKENGGSQRRSRSSKLAVSIIYCTIQSTLMSRVGLLLTMVQLLRLLPGIDLYRVHGGDHISLIQKIIIEFEYTRQYAEFVEDARSVIRT